MFLRQNVATLCFLLMFCCALLLLRHPETSAPLIDMSHDRTKIILVGLPRSGSLALYDFFNCHGWKSAHYCCGDEDTNRTHFPCPQTTCGACVHDNMLHQRPAFDKCSDKNTRVFSQFDVETAEPYAYFLPQHYTLPLLQQDYPDAVWILNTRDTPARWADNVMHWHSVTQRFFGSFASSPKDNKPRLAPRPHGLSEVDTRLALDKSIERAYNETAHRERHLWMQQVYQKHTRHVLQQAELYQKKLVLVNVDDPQAGEQLARAFGFPEKSECWRWNAAVLDDDWKYLTLQL